MPWDAVDHQGRWVELEDDVVRVYNEVKRLWPELEIKYCENPDIGDAPYMVIERTPDGAEHGVLTAWQLDDRLLDLLHQADTARHDVQAMLDRTNAQAKAAQQSKALSWRDYCKDLITSAARHIGTSYTFPDPREGHEGEVVKIQDG